ncbi:MAG: DUF4252 domain-containing protein [Planctomycetes bacterium]|nr:DUF4252 domain-containing protein [Planctomycetota bacterium]
MIRYCYLSPRHFAADVAVAVVMFCGISTAYSQSPGATQNAPAGRLNFEAANLPEANVEVDLSQEMFQDLFGIGDAAIAGVAESLLKSPDDGQGAKATRLAAHQLEAARQIMQLAGNVVREVHVRVYEDLPDEMGSAETLFKPFDEQLRAAKWETLARVRNNDDVARVAVIRDAGAVQGIFVVAADGNNIVLANVVCDISPDNVKKLTSAATKIGLENGLAQKIRLKLEPKIVITSGEAPTITVPATPPAAPTPPATK